MYRCARCVSPYTEQYGHISSREHAWLKSVQAQGCTHWCLKNNCHPRVMSHSLPHLTLTISTRSLSPTSPILPTISPSHPSPFAHDPYLPCEVPRQSGGSTQIPSLTGCEPKLIEPEDLEPRRIELDRNLGTDPYQTQERNIGNNYQNPIAEDMDEFGKVGVEMSYVQSQIHSDYDSAESIADSDLEDGDLRKMPSSPLYIRGPGVSESSRRPTASVKPDAVIIQRRGASAQRTQAHHSRRQSLMSSSSQEPRAPGKPNAMFHQGATNRETNSTVLFFKFADP